MQFEEAYVEIKCQLGATEVFIADLIACSTCFGHHYAHHQELKSIIQWLLPVVFKLLVWCGAEGYVSGLQDAAALLAFDFHILTTIHGQSHIKFEEATLINRTKQGYPWKIQ